MPPIILSAERRATIKAIIADALSSAMASDQRQTPAVKSLWTSAYNLFFMENFQGFVQFLVADGIFSIEQIRAVGDLPDAALTFFPGVLHDKVSEAHFADKQRLLNQKIIGFDDIVAIGDNAEHPLLHDQAKAKELAKRHNTFEWFCYKALRTSLEARIVKLKKNRSGRKQAKALRQWLLAREASIQQNATAIPYQLYTKSEHKAELHQIIQASKKHNQGVASVSDFADFINSLEVIYQYKDHMVVEDDFVAPSASLGEALLELLLSDDRDNIQQALQLLAGISHTVIKDFVKQYHQEFVRNNDFIGNEHKDIFDKNVCAAMATRIRLSPLRFEQSAKERLSHVLRYALTPYDPRFCNGFDAPIVDIIDANLSALDIAKVLTQSGSMREAMCIDKLSERKHGEFAGRYARFYRDATGKIHMHTSVIGQQRKADGEIDLCVTMRKFFDRLYGNALAGQDRVPISLVVTPYSQKGMAAEIYWQFPGEAEAIGLSKPKPGKNQNREQGAPPREKFKRFARKMVSRWLVNGSTLPGAFDEGINPFHGQAQRLSPPLTWYLTDEFIQETQALIIKVREGTQARLASCLATMTEFWGEASVLDYFCNAFIRADAVRFDSMANFQSDFLAKQEQTLQALQHLALDLRLAQLLVLHQHNAVGRKGALRSFFGDNPDYRLDYLTLKAATNPSQGKYFIKSPVLRAILTSPLIHKVKGDLVADTVASYSQQASKESAVPNSQVLLARRELELLLKQYRNDPLKAKGSRDSWVIQAIQRRINSAKDMLSPDDKRKILQDIRRSHWRLDRHRASYNTCARIVNVIYGRHDDGVDLYRELMRLSAKDYAERLKQDFVANRRGQAEYLRPESTPPAVSLPPTKATGWGACFFTMLAATLTKNTQSFL